MTREETAERPEEASHGRPVDGQRAAATLPPRRLRGVDACETRTARASRLHRSEPLIVRREIDPNRRSSRGDPSSAAADGGPPRTPPPQGRPGPPPPPVAELLAPLAPPVDPRGPTGRGRDDALPVLECAACGGRGAAAAPLLLCGRCRGAWFCSRRCQRQYWPEHGPRCARNDFADAAEARDPRFAAWMRRHGRQAVLRDADVAALERARAADARGGAAGAATAAEVEASLWGSAGGRRRRAEA